jgi:sodium transport system permease protein
VVMVAVGCFYPAVDSTAGERERNTWETSLTTAASRESIVLAKYLYVASFGCLAGVLNMIAMLVTLKPVLGPLLAREGEAMEFAVPLMSIPVLALATVLLAGFVAAGMMLFAAFARTFKEGQAMITPFYMIVLMPTMLLNVPGVVLTSGLALVPIANVTMVVRGALAGVFPWPQIAITVAVNAALVAVLLKLAVAAIGFEDVLVGSYGRSFPDFVRERVLRRRVAP